MNRLAIVAGAVAVVAAIGGVWRVRVEQGRATAAADEARAAMADAARHADALRLDAARAELASDPTRALATLALIEDATLAPEVRLVAAEARLRGVARIAKVGVRVTALATDGKRVAIGGIDGSIRVWTLDGDRIATLAAAGDAAIVAVAFVTASTDVVALDRAGTWRRLGGQAATEHLPGKGDVLAAAIAPDAAAAAVMRAGDSAAMIWRSGGFRALADRFDRFAWSYDGSRLAAASADVESEIGVALMDGATGSLVDHGPKTSEYTTAVMIHDGALVTGNEVGAMFRGSHGVRGIGRMRGAAITAFAPLEAGVLAAAASSDRERQVIVGLGGTFERRFRAGDRAIEIVPLDPLLDEPVATMALHTGDDLVDAIASDGGDTLVSAGRSGDVRMWRIPHVAVTTLDEPMEALTFAYLDGAELVVAGQGLATLAPPTTLGSRFEAKQFVSPQGRGWEHAGAHGGGFHIEYVNGKPVTVIDTATDAASSRIVALAVSRDRHRAVSLDELDGSAIAWDPKHAGTLLATNASAIAIDVDGTHAAVANATEVATWDARGAKVSLGAPHDPGRPSTNPAPDATHANPAPDATHANPAPDATHANPAPDATHANPAPDATHANDAPVQLACATTGAVALVYASGAAELRAPGKPPQPIAAAGIRAVVFANDVLVTGGADGSVTRTPGTALAPAGGAPVAALELLPDGRLVAASTDGTVRVWRADLATPPTTLRGHTATVTSVAASPTDPQRLVTGADDATIRVWDLTAQQGYVATRMPGTVAYAGYLRTGEIAAVDRIGNVRVLPADDLPADPAALRAWLTNASRFAKP